MPCSCSPTRPRGAYDAAPTRGDVVNQPEFDKFVREAEAAVPFYPTSTGYLMNEMIKRGPSGVTAAIVYENLVVEANRGAPGGAARIRLTEKNPVHIFTIAYGQDSDPKLLAQIAKATEAKAFEDGDDRNSGRSIREIFLKIATFF